MINIELVSWEDHYSHQGWQAPPTESSEYLANSIGWVIYEDKKKLVLAQSVADGSVADCMHIMKVNIKSRTIIKVPRGK